MEQENCTSLIQFWLTAESFTNELSSPHHVPDIERDTMDAIAIYERCDVSPLYGRLITYSYGMHLSIIPII